MKKKRQFSIYKKILLETVVITYLVVIVSYSQSAQPIKDPTYPSPNAASLGKYGDIPVSYHTGVPEVFIPIYTIQEGSLSVPVSLSYHSSGIRVDEIASWVGLGWSLNAGGMITRSVHGGPDEGVVNGTMPGALSPYTRWGWYKDGGILPEIMDCSSRPVSIEGPDAGTFPTWQGCARLYYEAAKGYIDCEPDLFTYSVGSYSGKFFFDANRQVHMIPETDLVIEPMNTPSYFYSWKIVAPDGTKYLFGGVATETSCSDPSENGSNKDVASSTTWQLYRIESPNGESWINFEYAVETYSFGHRGGHSVSFQENVNPGTMVGDHDDAPTTLSLSTVDGKRLSRITTSSGFVTVDFIASATARQDLTVYDKSVPTYTPWVVNNSAKSLQYIQINAGPVCKKFELSHDYYSSADCPGYQSAYEFDKKRLRLNWIQESVCGGATLPKYEFFYNTTLLPRRYSLGRDMWGYYNGYDTNTGLLEAFSNPVPAASTITYTTGNYRTVNETKSKAGILTKIKYPTGGTSEFDYECHRETETGPLIGGLRIKTLMTSDDYGNTLTTNYTYPQGKLYFNPANYKFQYPNNNDTWTGAFLGMLDFGILHSSNPVPAMWSTQGYHIGYSKVKAEQPGNGYTTYSYVNNSPSSIYAAQYPFMPLVASVGTSNPSNEETRNNSDVIVSSGAFNNQKTGTDKTIYARKVELSSCLNCSGSGAFTEYGLYADYSITTSRYNLVEKTEVKDGITTTTVLTYDPLERHNNPKTSEFTDSQGLTHKTEISYACDAGSGAPAAMYDKANPNFKNMLGAAVEQKTFVNNVLKGKVVTQYTQDGSRIFPTSSKNYPSGTAEFIEEQYQYDPGSNLTTIVKSTGMNKAFVWGYGNELPIASVENATYQYEPINKTMAFSTAVSQNTISCTSLSGALVINESQTVTFSPQLIFSSAGLWIKLVMKNSTGGIIFEKTYSTGGTYNETISVSAGSYTYCYEAGNYPSPFQGFSSINFSVSYRDGKRGNIFHTSFEENGSTISEARTGTKAFNGPYALVMPHVTGDYDLTYWKKPTTGGSWELVEQSVTITSSSTPDLSIGQAGYYLDEVRLYPKRALMTTYTYNPGVGITSSTDPNYVTTFYEYDAFGRLINMKDHKKNIVKAYQYHYKGQN
jgi:YD repeat-containing protein